MNPINRMKERAEDLKTNALLHANVAAAAHASQLRWAMDDLLKSEGMMEAALWWKRHEDKEPLKLARLAIKHLTRGAEDKWSGRDNDDQRKRHDAMLEAFQDLADDILGF